MVEAVKPLAGKVALVTGAGRQRGIGRAIALELARAGCVVGVHASGPVGHMTEEESALGWRGAASVAEEIVAAGGRALPLYADLRDGRAVNDAVEALLAQEGRIDILVNNAAAPRGPDRVPVTELSAETWYETLRVKLDGAFHTSSLVARHMQRLGNGGRIVNISSIGGKVAAPNSAAYAVANAGLQMLTAVMARELGAARITVNALCLGLVDTARVDDARDTAAWQDMLDQIPMGRAGESDEVGRFVRFLCTDEAEYLTGQSINLDGGWVIH